MGPPVDRDPRMTLLIIAVLTVIMVSATCSLFEATLYSVKASHIERMVSSGQKSGKIMAKFKDSIEEPITAILTLNTIANTAGAAFAGAAASAYLGEAWLGVFSLCLALGILVFSEIIPKTFGVLHSQSLAGVVARPIQYLVWLLTPAVWAGQGLTQLLISRSAKEKIATGQDISALARIGLKEGSLKPLEQDVISRILTLKEKTADHIMTPRTVVSMVQEKFTVEKVRSEASNWPYSRLPVYGKNRDDITGIVLRRDILQAAAEDQMDKPIKDLVRKPRFVPNTMALDQILNKFLSQRTHLFMVIDEHGNFQGVLSLEDILEEMIGREIVDETDTTVDLQALARSRAQDGNMNQGNKFPGEFTESSIESEKLPINVPSVNQDSDPTEAK